MFQEFYPLRLQENCDVDHMLRPEVANDPVTLRSSALEVMTDFSRVAPVTVTETMPVDDALEWMKRQHVRMLFVTNAAQRFIGVITARDISGNQIMQHMSHHGVRRDEVLVAHIMTVKQSLRSLTYEQVDHARIGDIMLTLKSSGDQHLLVLDKSDLGIHRIRGIISASDISRKLRVGFDVMYEAKSFAEIEKVISHGRDIAV
ncbi:MAG: CBS domain-containing protein [Amphritea sp.]|nr:CBS domain-containing protein [Amphritea sp.]